MFALLYGAGLRRAEAIGLDVADVDTATGELRIRNGKGRKERLAYVPIGGRRALEAWSSYRGSEPGPLLCPVRRETVVHRRLTAQAIYYVCKRRARQAGIPAFSPHDLRRTFITSLLEADADLLSVQNLAGHVLVATTARYDRRGERAKRKASDLLAVPYGGRPP